MGATYAEQPSDPDIRFSVVVPAAGAGVRMGGRRKPLLEVCGRPILFHTIERLLQASGCVEIVPVVHADELRNADLSSRLRDDFGITRLVPGGHTRQDSALAGLEAVRDDVQLVLIHDAVRPLVDPAVVRKVAEAAHRGGAAIAAVPAAETVKEVDAAGVIRATPPRERLYLARTPQGFRKDLILRAHYAAREAGFCGTDDAQLVERMGHEVVVVQDTYDNLKITTAEDLAIAEAVLRWRQQR
jgi:2-C-methyl-D-erythritol 4-phosphate cytidylyltransferase